jgi:hypothetical protein
VAAYTALKERIWADVHARGHENPLAPLLQFSVVEENETAAASSVEMPFVEERVAIEALRAGVPNRAAIRLLRTSEGELSERFAERLIQCRAGLSVGKAVEGEIVAGGFGTGKSHLLGFLAVRLCGKISLSSLWRSAKRPRCLIPNACLQRLSATPSYREQTTML